jgi:inorganic pyrophosphatase
MRIDAIAIGNNPPDDVNVLIEVPLGGQPIKYEMDKEAGTLVVDRFLYTPMAYPGNYGFVPHTLSEDGDPIDVLVCNTRQLIPGCVINVRPIGVLIMQDNAGQDEKILAVPSPHLTRRYEKRHEPFRSSGDHAAADRAFLRALQGPGARQVGEDRRLARRRGRKAPDPGSDRSREERQARRGTGQAQRRTVTLPGPPSPLRQLLLVGHSQVADPPRQIV